MSNMAADKDNLKPSAFPSNLHWSETETTETLEKMYKFVNDECERAIDWYFKKRQSKRIAGYTCRIGAIFAAALAGIIPILGEIYKSNAVTSLSPAWATVALAIAAVLVALDRLGGYTNGWIRYIRTGQLLSQLQSDFRLDWENQRIAMQGGQVNSDTVRQSIDMCKKFLAQVHSTVRAETDQWAREFQKVMHELEPRYKK